MKNNSIWEKLKYPVDFEELKENIRTDTLIIGAGITGLSVAYEMLGHSSNITIVDENKIYQGTTASTTAKITYQHGYIYYDLIKVHNTEKARDYYLFNDQGLKRIEEIVNKENIDCDFQKVNGYLYALNESEEKDIDNEYQAYQKIGIKAEITHIDQRITPYKALKVENQANFNVSKYLKGITDILIKNNVKIYEKTRIVDVYKDIEPVAITSNKFTIIAKNIIICSHYPIYKGFNFYFTKMIPRISYSIVSGPTNVGIENANYINTADPSIALRYIKRENDWLLNISGATHDAKKFKDYEGRIKILKDFGKEHFKIENYHYIWCTQDYSSTDYMPLVGRVKDNIYMATSYHEWGMANSVASSCLIKDLIIKNNSEFADVFNPLRIKLNPKFLEYNLTMIFTLLKTRQLPRTSVLNIPRGHGKVVKLGTKRVGIYKDEDDKLFIVDVTCPHLHCGLRYNPLEKTYDCKCHGSRFSYTGKLIDGPSLRDLYVLDLEDIKDYVVDETIKQTNIEQK